MFKILLLTLTFLTLGFGYKIFLMGGGVDDDQADIYTLMASETGRPAQPNKCSDDWKTTTCPRVAVVTSASPTTEDGNDEYDVEEDPGLMGFEQLFKFYGFSPKHITAHIDNYQTHTNPQTKQGALNLQILSTADLILFNGGDQSRHARTWLLNNGSYNSIMSIVAARAKNESVILAGTSAGTMIMGNPTYGEGSSFGHLYFSNSFGLAHKQVKDGEVDGSGLADVRNGTDCLLYDYNGGRMPGFGFAPDNFVTDTHFDRRSRLARLIPGVKSLNKTYGVGTDQGSTFYLNDDQGIALGKNGVFIVDISSATFNTSALYFNAKNVRVHYLTPGDRYNVVTKKLISSKPQILSPKYNGFVDSDDITSRYQMTRLITHLIDQTSSFNVGKTSEQQDFPLDTPTFTFTFSRDTKTKGYYGNGLYTAENVLVHINV